MREKLTDKFARTVEATPGKVARYFDTNPSAPSGVLLRVTAGARVWALRYRVKDSGREREITIGDVENRRLVDAYRRARELRRVIEDGGDPLGEREERRAAPDVNELVERFIAEALPSRAPRTQSEYRAMLRDWILPALGRLKVAAVSRDDIARLHQRITDAGKRRRANSVKGLCSTIFAQAIIWEIIADNPARHVKSNVEHGRERYLNEEELERLVQVLEERRSRRPDSVDAITLALLTGARRSELLTMRWADLSLDEGVWIKPASTTKQRKLHRVPLSEDAIAILRRRRDESSAGGKVVRPRADDYVFRGAGSKRHSNALERDWYLVRAAAGIEDVRFHDLRHSFASLLVGEGLSLPIIGKMLGHTQASTTSRYAHLADAPLRAAAELVAGKIGGRK
jgi:integrase